jgi:hypothetical protein
VDPRPAKTHVSEPDLFLVPDFCCLILKGLVVAAKLFIYFILLDEHESGSIGQPFVSFKALTTKIYLINGTNGLGGRQVLMFPEL